MSGNALVFRKDVNGLRAVAVLAVMLYHFGVTGFGGGFAGVDIFFVISGYLMSGIILTRLGEGNFSLAAFYMSRARRILPALAVMCLVLFVAGYFWLIPSDLEILGKHAAAAMTFCSNFVFKGEDGYFDAPMRDKWLLHTWSLSLEWQFYLLYPLFLMAWAQRPCRAVLFGSLLFLMAASGAMSVFLSETKASFSFYLLPARMWEFMAGALLWFLPAQAWSRRVSVMLETIGLLLIAMAFVLFDSKTPWPGYAALMPVLGTALVILAARKDSWLSGSLPAQILGKWSYSIYLWHWPVCVCLIQFGLTNGLYTAAGMAVSVVLGGVSYAVVEMPFRKKIGFFSSRREMAFLSVMAAATAVCGLTLFYTKGLPGRVPADIRAVEAAAEDRHRQKKQDCGFDKKSKSLKRCDVGSGDGEPAFVLWGDSHAGALTGAVVSASHAHGVSYSAACPTLFGVSLKGKTRSDCPAFNRQVFEAVQSLPGQVPLIIVNRFSYYLYGRNESIKDGPALVYPDVQAKEAGKSKEGIFRETLVETLCTVSAKRKLYIVKPIPEMGVDVPKTLARQMMTGRPAPDIFLPVADYEERHRTVVAALDEVRDRCGAILLDPVPYLCKDGRCLGSQDRIPFYFDDDHLNERGNQALAPMFSEVFAQRP